MAARLSVLTGARPAFLSLWLGLSISLLGAQVTTVALPLLAILVLDASAAELGILGAARWLPYLLFGLLAGVVLDRVPRSRVLVATHVGRALLLLSIPLAAGLGELHLALLVGVSFGVGALMILSDAAYQSVVPTLVGPAELTRGNAALETSRAVASVVGPGLGGVLVQLIGPPLAIGLDSLAFLVDAALVWRIRLIEPARAGPPRSSRLIVDELREGVAWVFGHPLLRPMQLCSMCFIGANSVWTTVYVLFLTRQLGLEAWQVGGLLAAGGPGALVGSMLSQRIVARFGLGRPIVISQVLASASMCLVPLAAAVPALVALPLLGLAAFSSNLMITLGSVCELTLRQQVTPDRLQGRMNATMRSLNWSTVAGGALIGGLLGERLGVVPALVVGTTGSLLSAGWVVCSPLRSLGPER